MAREAAVSMPAGLVALSLCAPTPSDYIPVSVGRTRLRETSVIAGHTLEFTQSVNEQSGPPRENRTKMLGRP